VIRRALLLLPLVAAIGCGSTVQTGANGQDAVGTDGLGVASGSTTGTGSSAGGDSSLSLPGGSSASASGAGSGSTLPGSSGAAGSAGASSTPASSGGAPAAVPGSHAPIRVGFEVIQGGNQLVTQGLGTPVNFGDGKAEVTGIVHAVNKDGGVNGHPILPFFGNWNAATQENGRESDCTKLTEDDKVSFIITVVNMSEGYAACAARHNVPLINASFGAGDDDMYRQFAQYLYTPSLLSLNKEEQIVLTTGHASGRVVSSKHVGVIVDNTPPGDPQYQRVLQTTVEPTLKSWNVPYETFSVTTQGDVNNAVLRFRADGVKTVVFVAPSGIIEILFMQAAEQQEYRPDYVLGDSTDPWFIGEAAPTAQVQHVSGAGSLPVSNVPDKQYPTTAREKECFREIATQGEDNKNRHASLTATVYCEGVDEFVAIASHVTGALTPASFYAAYPTVGSSYDPVTTFKINFNNGRHTGAAEYRTLGYTTKCHCIDYTGALRPVS
jgi:hypothetical protein